MVTILKATPRDIPYFRKIISTTRNLGNAVPPFYFRWVIKDGIALVAETDQKTAGFLVAERNDRIAYAQLMYLYVHPAYRSKGIGSQLMERFLNLCRKKKVKYIDLHAQADSVGFYNKFKFKEEGRFVALYRKWS